MAHFYKNIKKTELKVGLFVFLSILILFFSYSWLNDWFLKGNNEIIQVLFDNVNNLERGNAVYFRGVRVGRVSALNITNDGVLVELLIENNVKIDNAAIFLVKDRDMMGTKMVEIYPGQSLSYLSPNEIYRGISVPGLVDLITSLTVLVNNVERLMDGLNFTEDFVERLDRIISVTDNSLNEISYLVTGLNESDLKDSFTELKKVSSSIIELINNNSENLSTTFTRLDSLLINTSDFISLLQENITNEESSVHKLFNDEELYHNLINSTKEIENLIKDIQNNPHKYFRIRIF